MYITFTIYTLVGCLRSFFENQIITKIGTCGNSTGVEDGPASHSGQTTQRRHQEQARPAHKEVVQVISEPWPVFY